MGTDEAVQNFSQDVSTFSTDATVTHGSLDVTQVSTPNDNADYGDANEDSKVIPPVTNEDSILVNQTTADKSRACATSSSSTLEVGCVYDTFFLL